MRPGQNKRMRGRNNNRKGPNPLTRSYESNGPDVKIRGTAHHIAEKYLQLARDAHSSGDPVMAESYLQHAEHYFRLIAAAQQAQAQAQLGYQRPAGEAEPDEDEDDEVGSPLDRFASPLERVQPQQQPQPQPYQPQPYQPQPYQPNQPQPYAERPPQQERGNGEPRQDRGERQGQDRQDRQDRPPRQFDRNNGRDRWQSRQERGPREPRAEQPPRERIAEETAAPGLPAFITAPPRPVAVSDQVADEAPATFNPETVGDAGEGAGFHLRPRRRRRRPVEEGESFPVATQDAPVGE